MKTIKSLAIIFALVCSSNMSAQFTIDGILYNTTGSGTVCVAQPGVSYKGDIVIPPTVTYDGITYTVTQTQ